MEADPVAVDGVDGHRSVRRKEGEEPVSKHHIQPGCGE